MRHSSLPSLASMRSIASSVPSISRISSCLFSSRREKTRPNRLYVMNASSLSRKHASLGNPLGKSWTGGINRTRLDSDLTTNSRLGTLIWPIDPSIRRSESLSPVLRKKIDLIEVYSFLKARKSVRIQPCQDKSSNLGGPTLPKASVTFCWCCAGDCVDILCF